MSTRPRVPYWIRKFSYPDWTNVFQLVPSNDYLYGTETLFGDWNARVLLLAKDGCPTYVIRDRRDRGEPRPWRHGVNGEIGSRTNERLSRFVSLIPEKKLLYGSAAAHMLYDDDQTSRQLAGFKSGLLHDFLKRVLGWVLESMPRIEWVACLGEEAWFLTCIAIGNPSAAGRFKEYRDSHRPVTGLLGKKKITAFPLYHPGALGNAINEMHKGWRAFASALSAQKTAVVDDDAFAVQVTNSRIATRTRRTAGTLGNYETRNSAAKGHRIVTATLARRQCRVKFMTGKQVVHTSPQYNSCNTWAKIIAYARSKRGGAPANLPRAAGAIPQVLTPAGWVDVKE